jgi:hypothetical protein
MMAEGKRAMISVHKIQERLASLSQTYSQLPWDHIEKPDSEVLRKQENFLKRTCEILEASDKFDIGEISLEDTRTLFNTGIECVGEGLLSLPFEVTYVEATLERGTCKTRYGSVFAPASSCFDEADFERHPEFIGGTLALNFAHFNENGAAKGYWLFPTVITIFSRDFRESFAVPSAKDLRESAAQSEVELQDAKVLSTTMLYIMHSLINARGIELLTEPAPVNLNRKRIQRNKPPLYEHHILKIGGFSSSGRVLGVGASHASPRAHWRRGHIRTIRRGTLQQKRIPIPATLINGRGFISKDYEISR